MESKTENRLLIFMHIPKTGGTTLRTIINKQYSSEEIWHAYDELSYKKTIDQFLEKELQGIKVVKAHTTFRKCTHFSRPYTYITMLRHPIERLISLYYYWLRRKELPMHDMVKDSSLKEFVSRKKLSQVSNQQTYIMAGRGTFNFKKEHLILERAKENLNNYFSIVGITEMFNESVFLMKEEFGWDDISYTRKGVAKNRPLKKEISKEVIDIIKERNKLDIELYEYAKQNLKERINSLDTEPKQELDTFICENKKNNDANK